VAEPAYKRVSAIVKQVIFPPTKGPFEVQCAKEVIGIIVIEKRRKLI
jgi:hypothetical protein